MTASAELTDECAWSVAATRISAPVLPCAAR